MNYLSESEAGNVVVVTIEGLSKNLLGAYGSTVGRTPSIDRFAAWGMTLDQCFCDGPTLADNLRSLWTGQHALQSEQMDEASIWETLDTRGIPACLVTDSQEVAEEATALGCESPTLLGRPEISSPAESTEDCVSMQLFAAGAEELASEGRKGLVWLHSSGLRLPWDAPLELRRAFADPEDPEPPAEVGPPSFEVNESTDPDKLTGWLQVAAAQVAALDEGLEGLRQVVESRRDADTWSWCLLAPGGIPLGEAGHFGFPTLEDNPTHRRGFTDNTLGVPTILCPSRSQLVGERRSELYQLPDIHASLEALLGIKSEHTKWGRSVLKSGFSQRTSDWPVENQLAGVGISDECSWIRSPAWSAILDNENCELYVMPEDRWQVSNVAGLRFDICEMMRSSWQDFRTACESADRGSLPTLPLDLTNLIR